MSRSAAHARLTNVVVDRGVRIPPGLVVGEDPELDAQRFRRTDRGICLITQAMIDRLGRLMPLRVLSVASELFPLVKTGGLADVAGALPAALAPHGVAVRTLLPGYPAVLARVEGASPALALPDLFGGPARVLAARAGDLDTVRHRRAAPLCAADALYGHAGRRAALRGPRRGRGGDRRAARSRASCPTSCTRMTGRRGWRRPTCIYGDGGRGRAP